jgi:AraC family transcriptional activator of pobA
MGQLPDHDGPRVLALPQLTPHGAWQLNLAHDRPCHLILWITRGQGRLMLNGARAGFGPHNLIVIPAGTLFSLTPGPATLGHALELPPQQLPGTLENLLNETPRHLRLTVSGDQGAFTALFDASLQEQTGNQAHMTEVLRALVVQIVVRTDRLSGAIRKPRASERLMQRYCDLITNNYRNCETMAGLAARLQVTPTHLTRACRAATGLSAANLLAQRLAHEAASMLIESDLTAAEIAERLGFARPSNFSRFVQRHFGMSPGRLRKS